VTDLLAIDGLSVDLVTSGGCLRVVDDVSLRIGTGECVALVGESGCGKSMTALSVMRLLPTIGRISAGEIRFNGQDIVHLPPAGMRRLRGSAIGMVFQDPMTFLNPLIRVGDQIVEALRLHTAATRREAAAQALATLRRVRIPDPEAVYGYYPHQLSGGMRQRVLIAVAIACRPSLLICDEPTTALDVTVQAQIMDLLRVVREEFGSATLLISHDLGLVGEYCDRAYVMYAGRVVEHARVADIFATPAHPYTRGLLRSTLRADQRQDVFHTIDGQPPNMAYLPTGCHFHPRCPEAFDRCAVVTPKEYPLGGDRRARCLLHEATP
jgi:oligopeptide/dipeptide ABC transporter ATP-binding protein